MTGERKKRRSGRGVKPAGVTKEIKFFENIGSPEGGRETGNSGDNARQNAQIILVLYVSRCLSIFTMKSLILAQDER